MCFFFNLLYFYLANHKKIDYYYKGNQQYKGSECNGRGPYGQTIETNKKTEYFSITGLNINLVIEKIYY